MDLGALVFRLKFENRIKTLTFERNYKKNMAKNTTIIDISRALGISKSTVSRALADRLDVKPETKEKVLEMAKKMHYRPNQFAKNLIKKRTKIIGVVVPEFINSFFARIIIQIQNVFEKEGFHVLITQCNESAELERRNLEILGDSMVEGILISVSQQKLNSDYYQELIDRGIPLVFFNRPSPDISASRVVIDDYKWADFAVEHLIEVRRKIGDVNPRIMHFRGPSAIDLSHRRYQGYLYALQKHGIEFNPQWVVQCKNFDREEGYNQMMRCIDQGLIPDALFAFNDPLAIGAMKALLKCGYQIPKQVSVMGFTESQSASVTSPMLTSVAQPLEQMGETAAKLLLDKIENPHTPNRTVVLEGELHIRESTSPFIED